MTNGDQNLPDPVTADLPRPAAEAASAPDPRLDILRWEQAEASLFALAVADTELYELAVNATVAVRDELRRRCHTMDELIGVSVRDVAGQSPLLQQVQQQGLDARAVFDSARAQRRRELQADPRS